LEILKELGIDPQLVFVNALAFLALLWLLKRFLFKPVSEILALRQEEIRTQQEEASRNRTVAEELRRAYEERLAAIEAEAREKIQAAIKEGQDHAAALLAEAREQAEKVLKRGEEELKREYAKAMVQLREDVVGLAVQSAGKLIDRSLDDATHRALIREFIESIEVPK